MNLDKLLQKYGVPVDFSHVEVVRASGLSTIQILNDEGIGIELDIFTASKLVGEMYFHGHSDQASRIENAVLRAKD